MSMTTAPEMPPTPCFPRSPESAAVASSDWEGIFDTLAAIREQPKESIHESVEVLRRQERAADFWAMMGGLD